MGASTHAPRFRSITALAGRWFDVCVRISERRRESREDFSPPHPLLLHRLRASASVRFPRGRVFALTPSRPLSPRGDKDR
eukprot:156734-Prymnesium_polylepis.1